ncbi:hypothetical protein HGO38_13430 [Rhizobium sp. CG5]|uniref:hypothetical protein n=1 Tax=Rhizobium sp. CG5 TaxID=2726076 RepID=UPI0020347165|nr:hypothetical protein [Rhizobium sp. CG5]MCM2474477.1 hypothetical protein [Rhizobium sp. CG5]
MKAVCTDDRKSSADGTDQISIRCDGVTPTTAMFSVGGTLGDGNGAAHSGL